MHVQCLQVTVASSSALAGLTKKTGISLSFSEGRPEMASLFYWAIFFFRGLNYKNMIALTLGLRGNYVSRN